MNNIIWLTGPSGCGKTSIAQKVANFIDVIILDGDSMRNSISLNEGFSPEDRLKHNLRVGRLASELVKQKNVIVTLIAPSKSIREKIKEVCDPEWVYIKRDVPEREGHYYEIPEDARVVDNNNQSIEESAENIQQLLQEDKPVYSLFIGRWQCLPPHAGHLSLFDIVRDEGKKILIAIRDTEIDGKNPYSVQERIKGLRTAVPDAEIIVIPDIEEVCFGRGAGYGIREIELPEEIQKISGTTMRKEGKG